MAADLELESIFLDHRFSEEKKGGFLPIDESQLLAFEPTTVLLMIDWQIALGFDQGERCNPQAEQAAAALLSLWRERKLPVIHVFHTSLERHSNLRAGEKGHAIHPLVTPMVGEVTFEKHVNSAFIGTELLAHLRSLRCKDLVITGLTTDHCVSTSVRMAANLGFRTWLVEEATATFKKYFRGTWIPAETVHTVALASLHGEFCHVISLAQLHFFLRLKEVRSFVAHHHGSQKRGAQPYLVHLNEVAEILYRHLPDDSWRERPEIIIAGYCHDLIEDTEITAETLAAVYGDAVCNIVLQVTDNPAHSPAERKRTKVAHAADMAVASRAVKLADLISNLESLFFARDHGNLSWSEEELFGYTCWGLKLRECFGAGNDEHLPWLSGLFARFDAVIQQERARRQAAGKSDLTTSKEALEHYYSIIYGSN